MISKLREGSLLYFVVILLLLVGCIYLFASKSTPQNQTTGYKYKIYTPTSTYFTNDLECGPNGEIGFHNSNGVYVQIK